MLEGDHFFLDTKRPLLLDAIARRLLRNKTLCLPVRKILH